MPIPPKIGQKVWDDLNTKLLERVRANVFAVNYRLLQNASMRCQIVLQNGLIVEGFAQVSRGNDGKMEARRKALKSVILIEQYLEAERLYREALAAPAE